MPRRHSVEVAAMRLGHECPHCGVYIDPSQIVRLDIYGGMFCPYCKREYPHPPPPAR